MDADLFCVLSNAVEELGLELSPPEEPSRSRLDERFLPSGPFSTSFTILPRGPRRDHQILGCTLLILPLLPPPSLRSTTRNKNLPPLDESVAAHLCLPTAIGWKAKATHGRSMASLVGFERHLWLNLTEMDADKVLFLDSPVSPTSLFGPAVVAFAERFTATQKLSQAMWHFLPKRSSSAAATSCPKIAPLL